MRQIDSIQIPITHHEILLSLKHLIFLQTYSYSWKKSTVSATNEHSLDSMNDKV